MGEIYKKAEEVLVWLGPSDEKLELAFRFLKVVGQMEQSHIPGPLPTNPDLWKPNNQTLDAILTWVDQREEFGASGWAALKELLRHA